MRVFMPTLSQDSSGARLVRWMVAEGDFVRAGDPLCEIACSSSRSCISAEVDGFVSRLLASPGPGSIAANEPIAVIACPVDVDECAVATAMERSPAQATRRLASPLARRLADENGVPLEGLDGSGPGGRIVKADVMAAVNRSSAAAPPLPPNTVSATTSEPLLHIRREVRVGRLTEMLQDLAEAECVGNLRPGMTLCILRACARAARETQVFDGTRVAIVTDREALNLAVFDSADEIGFLALCSVFRDKIDAARQAGSPGGSEADLVVANLGALGVESFQPSQVAPHFGILAVGAVRTVFIPDSAARPVAAASMTLTLSLRLDQISPVGGAKYLAAVATLLERPSRLLV